MIKQFLLIIVSLGLTAAFGILSRPLSSDGTASQSIAHLVQRCAAPAGNASGETAAAAKCLTVGADAWAVFLLYILICTRFLLSNWLYLSSIYADPETIRQRARNSSGTTSAIPAASPGAPPSEAPPEKPRPHIRWDAIGVVCTGLILGIQSAYAAPSTLYDFFVLFAAILFFDLVTSALSLRANAGALKGRAKRDTRYWNVNNVLFLAAALAFLYSTDPSAPPNVRSGTYIALSACAFLNCVGSLAITLHSYFTDQEWRDRLLGWVTRMGGRAGP